MTQSTKLNILACMPAYNESKYIGSIILNTKKYVDSVIVIDDGSTDGTAETASLAGAEVVRHEKNKGYGAAIKRILAEAKTKSPDILVILDADSQHDPEDIPKLVKPIIEGYDFVIGSRAKQSKNIPLYRRFGQKIISRSVNALSKNSISDTECGFRAFSRKAYTTLDLKEDGMAVSAETVAEANRKNLRITEVPVSISYTRDSSTLNPVAHGLGVFTKILVMISERRPLFFFGLAGIILIVIGLVAGFVALRLYSSSGVVSVGWSLIAIFFMILGTISFFTGLMLRSISSVIQSALSKEKR